MQGNARWQVNEIFKEIKQIGSSKYEAKNEARLAGAHGSAGIAKETGIYGYRTADAYRTSIIGFGNWVKENLYIKDLTKVKFSDVKAYLDSRLSAGIAHKTFQLEKAALNKFETALNKYSQSHNLNRTYDFKLNENFKEIHKNLAHADVKAYDDKIVNKLLNIENKTMNLAVRLAFSAGLRKSEILKLNFSNLKENSIQVLGSKGGKDRIVSAISDKTLILNLKAFLQENKKFGDMITGSQINYQIAKITNGSGSVHALRHNYAINTVKYFINQGYTRTESVHLTSVNMGHNRNEIIEMVYGK